MGRLEVEDISKMFYDSSWSRSGKAAVEGVSFAIEGGRTLALVGMSGSGKTTIASMIAGLIRPDSGRIIYDGRDITDVSPAGRKERARIVQMLFQHPGSSLHPIRTIEASLREVFVLHPDVAPESDRIGRIEEILTKVELDAGILSRCPHQLSGGQLQRACLARTLLLKPSVLILDEPTSMLDVSIQAFVMNLLERIQGEEGLSYLLITHDLELARVYAHDIGIMKEGRLTELRRTEELFMNPEGEYTKELLRAIVLKEDV